MASVESDASMIVNNTSAPSTKKELNAEQIGYLVLMWVILGINVMLITLMSAPYAHC